jgi:hypothetical protein
MRAELESCSDFSIRHAARHVLDDLAFARGKQFDSFVIGAADERRVGQRLQSMIQIDAARPYLSFVNVTDALAQALNPLVLGENSLCAGAKALEDFLQGWKSPAG